MAQEFSEFFVVRSSIYHPIYKVHQFPEYLILQRKDDPLLYIYKEYQIPVQIGNSETLAIEQLQQYLQQRQNIQSQGLLQLHKFILDSSEKMGLLYESYLKNFDEELSVRRGTNNYWSEEELLNTFQACLQSLQSYHQADITHSGLGPQSIIFSQEGLVKLADHFVISEDYRRNWYCAQNQQIEYGFWSPEIINDWQNEVGWKLQYETIEADLWALGLVFLEAMTLQSNYEIYFLEEQEQKLMIDSQLLEKRLKQASEIYSPILVGLLEILLDPNENERNWDKVLQFLGEQQMQDIQEPQQQSSSKPIHQIASSLEQVQRYIEGEPCQQPQQQEEASLPNFNNYDQEVNEDENVIQNEDNEEDSQTKNRLTDMLENCLQKSKELIQQNEYKRKTFMSTKQDNNTYFTLNQPSDQHNYMVNQTKESKSSVQESLKEVQQSKKTMTNGIESIDSKIPGSNRFSTNQDLDNSRQQFFSQNHNSSQHSQKREDKFQIPQQQEELEEQEQEQEYEQEQQQIEALKDVTNEQQKYGVVEYENDIIYKGQISKVGEEKDLLKHGFGALMHKDGNLLYQGEWKEDNFEGQGFLYNFALGENQCENERCDYKDFTNLSSIWIKYSGQFEQGVMNGKGQLTFIDGSIYQGSFHEGTINGYGMFISKDGELVIGKWQENQLLTQLS